MPMEGDTLILDISDALAAHGLELKSFSASSHKKGGAPFYLLQEVGWRLIINIKLTDQQYQTMSHFIEWDGEMIRDHPKNIMISKKN